MWSGKKKKGSAEDFFKEEEFSLDPDYVPSSSSLGSSSNLLRKSKSDKDEKEKRKKEKEKEKEDKEREREDKKRALRDSEDGSSGGGGGHAGLFQRRHKKNTGSTDIDKLKKDKEKEEKKEKEKSGGRVFHRRNKSSSFSDPTAAEVVASAASRLNVLTPDRDVKRLSIKRETLSPPGTLNLSSGLLSSFPPNLNSSSPRSGNSSPRSPLAHPNGSHSGPMQALPQLAELSHRRKSSIDDSSPRVSDSPLRSLADTKPSLPISEMLLRSPLTSPRSPITIGREVTTDQQRQVLAQTKKKLQLELEREREGMLEKVASPRAVISVIESWDESQEIDATPEKEKERDEQELAEWERECQEKMADVSRSSEPTSALGQYLISRWKDQQSQQSTK